MLSGIKVSPKISSFVSTVYTQGCQYLGKKQIALCLGVISGVGVVLGTARYLRSKGHTDIGTTLSHIMNFFWRRNGASRSQQQVEPKAGLPSTSQSVPTGAKKTDQAGSPSTSQSVPTGAKKTDQAVSPSTPQSVPTGAKKTDQAVSPSTPQSVPTGAKKTDQAVSPSTPNLVLTDRPQPKALFMFEQVKDSDIQAKIMEAIDKISPSEKDSFRQGVGELFNEEMSDAQVLIIVQALAGEGNLQKRDEMIRDIKELFSRDLTNEAKIYIAEHILHIGSEGMETIRFFVTQADERGFSMSLRFLLLLLADVKTSKEDCMWAYKHMLTYIDDSTPSLYNLYVGIKNGTVKVSAEGNPIQKMKQSQFSPLASPRKEAKETSAISVEQIKETLLNSFDEELKDDDELNKLVKTLHESQTSIEIIFASVSAVFSNVSDMHIKPQNIYRIFDIAIKDVKETVENNKIFTNAAPLFEISNMDFIEKNNFITLLESMKSYHRQGFCKQVKPLFEQELEGSILYDIVNILNETPNDLRKPIIDTLIVLFREDFGAEQKIIIAENIFAIGIKDQESMDNCKRLILSIAKKIKETNPNLCMSDRFLDTFFKDFMSLPNFEAVCERMVESIQPSTESLSKIYATVRKEEDQKEKRSETPYPKSGALKRTPSFNRLRGRFPQPGVSSILEVKTPEQTPKS